MIAETFARIFYRNAINIGLPIIECPEASRGIEDGDQVEVDFDSGVIYNRTRGTEFQGQAFPEFMQNIIQAGGLIKNRKINIYQLPDPGQVSEADFLALSLLSISFVFCKRRKTEYGTMKPGICTQK